MPLPTNFDFSNFNFHLIEGAKTYGEASKSSAGSSSKGPTGPEIIDQMVASPTLDRFFINKPNFTDEELMEFVKTQQAERALWEVKQK